MSEVPIRSHRIPLSLLLMLVVGCAGGTSRGPRDPACVISGPAAELALARAGQLLSDTSSAAKEKRSRLGLANLTVHPRVVVEEELCARARELIGGIGRSRTTRSVTLVQIGPVFVARADSLPFPEYYIGQRLPYGPVFEIIEVLTVPD